MTLKTALMFIVTILQIVLLFMVMRLYFTMKHNAHLRKFALRERLYFGRIVRCVDCGHLRLKKKGEVFWKWEGTKVVGKLPEDWREGL